MWFLIFKKKRNEILIVMKYNKSAKSNKERGIKKNGNPIMFNPHILRKQEDGQSVTLTDLTNELQFSIS